VSSQHDPRRRHHVVNQSTVGRHLDRKGHVRRVAHRATADLAQQALPRRHVPRTYMSNVAQRLPQALVGSHVLGVAHRSIPDAEAGPVAP
jgi:hypothetical protein